MLTKEQIDIINQSIINIKTLCSSMASCMDCPMNPNCNQYPQEWETTPNDN